MSYKNIDQHRDELKTFLSIDDGICSQKYSSLSEEEKERWDEIIETIPGKIINIAQNVKDRRNDINHFGFNFAPMSAQTLRNNLKKYFGALEAVIDEMNKNIICDDENNRG